MIKLSFLFIDLNEILFRNINLKKLYFEKNKKMQDSSKDLIDLQLLDALQRDASRSNQDLAAALGISPATCLRRTKRLKDAGLIEHQMAVLSSDRLKAFFSIHRAKFRPLEPLPTASGRAPNR